jgi:hypothetical protein
MVAAKWVENARFRQAFIVEILSLSCQHPSLWPQRRRESEVIQIFSIPKGSEARVGY